MGTMYFVRHGETDADKENRFNGGIDLDLNKTGIQQAQVLAEKLARLEFDKIFCSPKKRAVQTCEIISNLSGKKFTIDERLTELVCGIFDGKRKSLILKIRFLNALKKGKHGVEHLVTFTERNVNFCESVLESMKNKVILVVSHHGNASAFDFFFKGKPKKYSFAKRIVENGGILKFEY